MLRSALQSLQGVGLCSPIAWPSIPACSATCQWLLQSFSLDGFQQQANGHWQLQHCQQYSTGQAALAGLAFQEVYADAGGAPANNSSSQQQQNGPITAVFLHGLLGSSRNWRTFSKKLAQEAAAQTHRAVRILLADLRCHGASSNRPGLHPPHDMHAAAADVAQLIQQQLEGQAPHFLVGLSLGGKVVLELLKQMAAAQQQQQQAPNPGASGGSSPGTSSSSSSSTTAARVQGVPQQVWILDSQPGSVSVADDAPTSVGRIIQVINNIPTPLDGRQELYTLLQQKGVPLPVAQWLGTSLVPAGHQGNSNGGSSDGKLDWLFDVQGAAALYHSYRVSSYWDVFRCPPPSVTIHMVRGELSDRWTPKMLEQLIAAVQENAAAAGKAPGTVGQLKVHVLENAGHWLQADNPDGLKALMLLCIKELS